MKKWQALKKKRAKWWLSNFWCSFSPWKLEFEQLSKYKNTFIRTKNSRWRITAPGWKTGRRKDALRCIVKIDSRFHPSTPKLRQPYAKKGPLPLEEEEWNQHPASSQTPEPAHPITRPAFAPLGGSLQTPGNLGPLLTTLSAAWVIKFSQKCLGPDGLTVNSTKHLKRKTPFFFKVL